MYLLLKLVKCCFSFVLQLPFADQLSPTSMIRWGVQVTTLLHCHKIRSFWYVTVPGRAQDNFSATTCHHVANLRREAFAKSCRAWESTSDTIPGWTSRTRSQSTLCSSAHQSQSRSSRLSNPRFGRATSIAEHGILKISQNSLSHGFWLLTLLASPAGQCLWTRTSSSLATCENLQTSSMTSSLSCAWSTTTAGGRQRWWTASCVRPILAWIGPPWCFGTAHMRRTEFSRQNLWTLNLRSSCRS